VATQTLWLNDQRLNFISFHYFRNWAHVYSILFSYSHNDLLLSWSKLNINKKVQVDCIQMKYRLDLQYIFVLK
jgi:hypothetical protein